MNLHGSAVALVTPWKEDDTLDIQAFEQLIDWHNASGTQALVVAGSTGEGNLLTRQERSELIQTAVKLSKAPIIVGCGTPSTRETIQLGDEALALGAAGLLVVVPFYVKPTSVGIVAHFNSLCRAWQAPVVLYNNPSRCGVDLSIEAIEELSGNEHVVGLKDSSTDLGRIAQIRKVAGREFKLLAGEDGYAPEYMQKGGDGWISVVGNVAPAWCRQVCDSHGKETPEGLNELMDALGVAGNPVAIKEALSYTGRTGPHVRLPLMRLARTNERLKQAVAHAK